MFETLIFFSCYLRRSAIDFLLRRLTTLFASAVAFSFYPPLTARRRRRWRRRARSRRRRSRCRVSRRLGRSITAISSFLPAPLRLLLGTPTASAEEEEEEEGGEGGGEEPLVGNAQATNQSTSVLIDFSLNVDAPRTTSASSSSVAGGSRRREAMGVAMQ